MASRVVKERPKPLRGGFGIARRAAIIGLFGAASAWAEVPSSASRLPNDAHQRGDVATTTPPNTATPRDTAKSDTAKSDTAAPDAAAQHFVETCSGCHTIGGGAVRGPDLAAAAAWPDAQLAHAIKSMERKVGPLTTAHVDALAALLKDKDAQARIARARASLTHAAAEPTEAPDSKLGGALFFGHVGLKNGGMACSGCHRFRGEGGTLGPDLSHFADPTEIETLAPTLARAAFPVMRAAYEAHPITTQEARHLAAFMKQAKAQRIVAPFANTTLTGFMAGFGAFALVLAAILTRPQGVRARLVRRATKR